MFLVLFLHLLLHKSECAPAEMVTIDGVLLKEVNFGQSVLLKCRSNDRHYNFDYWLFSKGNTVIGPSNSYDKTKYRYEILSGNLTVRGATKNDEGLYSCVSKEVRGNHVNVKHVQLMVLQDLELVYEHDSQMNTIRILIVLIILVLLSIGGFYLYTVWRDRFRHPSYLEQEDEDDDDESAEEIFTAPSTSGLSSKPGPSKPAPPIVIDQNSSSYDNNISTDFISILDRANDK